MRVATWNVLADGYLLNGENDYSHVDPKLMVFGGRLPHVLDVIAELRELDVKILSLQEVDYDLMSAINDTKNWQMFWCAEDEDEPIGELMLIALDIPVTGHNEWPLLSAQSIAAYGALFINAHIYAGVSQARTILQETGYEPAVMMTNCNGGPGARTRRIIRKFGFDKGIYTGQATRVVNSIKASADLIVTRDIDFMPVATRFNLDAIPNTSCPSDHIPMVVELAS